MYDEAVAPSKRARELAGDHRIAKRPRHRDVRLGVEMQVSELTLTDVKVRSIDDRLVSELPVRARVDGGPPLHDAGDVLGSALQRGALREVTFFAQLHHARTLPRIESQGTPSSRPDRSRGAGSSWGESAGRMAFR
jgi:hypothetical protein